MRFSHVAPLCISIAAGLGACTDSSTPLQPDVGPSLSAAQPGALRDPAVNRGDTHFSAKLVTRTSLDAGAPEGGEMFAAQEVYERYDERYLEGGYDAGGDVLFGVYWDDPVASPVVASVRSTGDHVYMYDRWGGLLMSDYFDAFMAQHGLPGGTLIDAFFDEGGGSGECSPEVVICDSEPLMTTAGVEATAKESGEWKEVRTVLSPAAGEVGTSFDRAGHLGGRRYGVHERRAVRFGER